MFMLEQKKEYMGTSRSEILKKKAAPLWNINMMLV